MYIGLCYRLFTSINLYLEMLKTCKNSLEREYLEVKFVLMTAHIAEFISPTLEICISVS